ncbi:hypothetical protein TELCIR_01933 [Teladorsagia circumcincta]|uniref:Uncharacterized protein n=1 Tax=Teladorsagia circumcincta TaxID=45464 RepID=A0A2G9V2R3_TELCI|nr:hypothetical protein TELCIR_01933 [Teladorsagia circumcincta]
MRLQFVQRELSGIILGHRRRSLTWNTNKLVMKTDDLPDSSQLARKFAYSARTLAVDLISTCTTFYQKKGLVAHEPRFPGFLPITLISGNSDGQESAIFQRNAAVRPVANAVKVDIARRTANAVKRAANVVRTANVARNVAVRAAKNAAKRERSAAKKVEPSAAKENHAASVSY